MVDHPAIPSPFDVRKNVRPSVPVGPSKQASDHPDAAVRLTILQRRWTQNILPVFSSLMLHATIIIVGLLTIKAMVIIKAPSTQDQIIIPDFTIDPQHPAVVPRAPSRLQLPPTKSAQDAEMPTAFDPTTGPKVSLPGSAESGDFVIGPGAFPQGNNHRTNRPAADDGPYQFIGIPGGRGSTGNGIGLFGPPGGNVRLVAFVCDASGSMLPKWASLTLELNRSVQNFGPWMGFNIIFFQDQRYASLDSALISATPDNKRRAAKFLAEVSPSGTTDPIPGIELAFRQHPQLIYLLTDGDFPDNEAVLKCIRQLDRDHKVRINTIAFVTPADTDTNFISLLQTIATETAGTFKKVTAAP